MPASLKLNASGFLLNIFRSQTLAEITRMTSLQHQQGYILRLDKVPQEQKRLCTTFLQNEKKLTLKRKIEIAGVPLEFHKPCKWNQL